MDFSPLQEGTLPVRPVLSRRRIDVTPNLSFELTPFQKEVSKKAREILESQKNCLIYAAAGSGKTEISYESICSYLRKGKKVCFAISRRQVVLEIAERLKSMFPSLSVIAVCQGHTSITDADLIVCTTHQLYRYPFSFDLLILDELDAFPYCGNEVLEAIAAQSCTGQILYLSATPDEKSLQEIREGKMEMVTLFSRPHKKPLCVPALVRGGRLTLLLRLLHKTKSLMKKNRQVLIYVPRIRDLLWMECLFKTVCRVKSVHSGTKDKDEILDAFRKKEMDVLLCTTLLERGITIPSVQVLVYLADHPVFTCASLIQIFGRVGRSMNDPQGEGVCYIRKITKNLAECISQIEMMNRSACGAPGKQTKE